METNWPETASDILYASTQTMIGATAQDLYNAMVVLRPDDPKDELMSLALEQMKLPQKRRRVVATNHWTETSFRFTPPRKQSVSVHSTPVKKGPSIYFFRGR